MGYVKNKMRAWTRNNPEEAALVPISYQVRRNMAGRPGMYGLPTIQPTDYAMA